MANANMNCSALLLKVYETGFAVDDVVLFLDTHPNDPNALNYYRYAAKLREQAMKAYEQQCGPLMLDEVGMENYWSWVNSPWPWEGVCG